MMKNVLLIVLVGLLSFQSFGQDPEPELFRTWYLYFVQVTDEGYNYDVSNIDPPITPFITISEDLSFNGEGACNSFTGIYEYFDPNLLSAINNFNETDEDCGIHIHNTFESGYFGFIGNEFWYEITEESDGLTLTASSALMGYAIFKEFPLSGSDFNKDIINLFPNPTSDQLFISSENTVVEKIIVYSINGKVLFEAANETNSIDVSTLSKGVYFIELSSSDGKSVQKFIKN